MNRALLIRAAGLYLPIAITTALWLWRRPGLRDRGALLLSAAWNLPALLVLHALARQWGWWRFEAEGGLLLGFPVDLYLGWALLWGPASALAFPSFPLIGVLALGALLDLVAMPSMKPVVLLGPRWLLGEAVGLLLVLLPAQLLARWTREDRHLAARASLQVALFAGIFLGVLPAIALGHTGMSFSAFLGKSQPRTGLWLQLIAIAAVPGLSAVQEFCRRGLGTPLPYDSPRKLVTSGVYAYVGNPMQASMTLVLVIFGLPLGRMWIVAPGLVSFAYGAGLAAWHEDREVASRFGQPWNIYRHNVRRWLPRWRPFIASPARIFVAQSCGPCSEIGAWLLRRSPVGLEILPAEHHPSRDLTRLTYEAADGAADEGVAAFARALEHIHLGWAFLGWTMRLPILRPVLQIVLDASGGGPKLVRRQA